MSITTPSDYKGFNCIVTNSHYGIGDLQLYIDKYEKYYLELLLGCNLANLFLTDYNTNPFGAKELRFQAIFNQICFSVNWCDEIVSRGVKEMLIGFIYVHYTKDIANKSTSNGKAVNKITNSENSNFWDTNMPESYNKSVDDFRAIQYYICYYNENYSEYRGQDLDKLVPFFLF